MKSKATPIDENMPRCRTIIRPEVIAEETTTRSAGINLSRGALSVGNRNKVLGVAAPDIA